MSKSQKQTDEKTVDMVEIKFPSFYRVLIHNDNTTPIDLVLFVLVECAELNKEEAYSKAMEAHESGSAVIGVHTESKADEIISYCGATAALNGYPDFTLTKEKENE